MAHIVILGAGYAGLGTARKLAKIAPEGTTIDLIDRNTKHVESIQLYRVAAGTAQADDISLDIASVIPDNVNFIQATVSKVDYENKKVEFEDHAEISYDYVVLSLGFRSENFGMEGADKYSYKLQDIPTAEKIYQVINSNIRDYKQTQDPNDLNIAVCGAGFTGIELLGELIDTAKVLKAKYNVPEINITSLEMAPQILPMFDSELAQYAYDFLSKNGIKILTGAKIKKIEQNAVVYTTGDSDEEQRVYANSIIWTVGVSGSDVIKNSGFDAKRNRIVVTDYLNVEDHPEIYVLGDDSASMDPQSGRPLPTTGQLAQAQAAVAAVNIAAAINDAPQKKFVYKSMGTVASLGPNHGIIEMTSPHIKLKGHLASLAKRASFEKVLFGVGGVKGLKKV
ncbi:MAG: NAD(P)/FAD-dependent oxidoreductase [Lactobacillus sp.]|uniref:NAD(P)/FAD-dependent oxidoreductase n=1 Tax=Bombilactobacillus bombi TaxID=1303590 RepID=A0A417ZK24_9LACO|nr:NAD(P)/FAD-dependent oxidoreductase [Bombilactobacillus bombi]MCO6543658.1 NAD(P)/FAD-dependent oxidoreductase [Lactobacillus sp.]RHW52253.1 NAD(P)/FAD-dependent oxidoreductase [Bombilactobacillus bombi]